MPKGLTRLSPEDYKSIVEALETPYYGINTKLARKYGVSEKTIRKIRLGQYKVQ